MTLGEEQKDAFKKILDACAAGKTSDEVSIYEDLYGVDAQEAFKQLCESELGMSGMRLDLFIDGYTPRKRGSNGIQQEKEEDNLD
jgi:hypothetical protein